MLKPVITVSLCCATGMAYAEQYHAWLDRKHQQTSQQINRVAHRVDDWFGEPKPDAPASATLRVMLDATWNKHDSLKIEPRVRGRIKLPTLEEKVSVVFGDDSLDHEKLGGQHDARYPAQPQINQQTLHRPTAREDNSSIALRWSSWADFLAVDTDVDVGVRSGDDVYVRFEARKKIPHRHDTYTELEQMYRYGTDSHHFARTSAELKHQQNDNTLIANYIHADYADNGNDKGWTWGNTAYRQHQFSGNKRLNYGIQAGGTLGGRKHQFNSYGAFVSWRQPVWRDWLFAQTELTYANNKDEGRRHYAGTFVRLEAVF